MFIKQLTDELCRIIYYQCNSVVETIVFVSFLQIRVLVQFSNQLEKREHILSSDEKSLSQRSDSRDLGMDFIMSK